MIIDKLITIKQNIKSLQEKWDSFFYSDNEVIVMFSFPFFFNHNLHQNYLQNKNMFNISHFL